VKRIEWPFVLGFLFWFTYSVCATVGAAWIVSWFI